MEINSDEENGEKFEPSYTKETTFTMKGMPRSSRIDERKFPSIRNIEQMKTQIENKRREKQVKKVWWLTRSMAEEISREAVLATAFREIIVYIIFAILVIINVISRKSSTRFYLSQALKELILEKDFRSFSGEDMDFKKISTISDIWQFSETILVDSLFLEKYYDNSGIIEAKEDDKKILYENKLLGVARIRQLRVRNDSCKVEKNFRSVIKNCYDHYTHHAKEFGPFGTGNGTAWTYNPKSVTKHLFFIGKIATYEGGGYYTDLTAERQSTKKVLIDLRKNLWITRETRAVFVHFSLYNANLNLFLVCILLFEFPPTGGVFTKTSFQPVSLLPFITTSDYVGAITDILMLLFVIFYFIQEIREIIYFKWRYLFQFWSYVESFIILTTFGSLIPTVLINVYIYDEVKNIMKNPDKYGNLEHLAFLKRLQNDMKACVSFVVFIKSFKYLSFNKTMGQLNNTLKRSAMDILAFCIMFFIIFFAFAELGHLLFGNQILDYSTFSISMFTLLRTILGDFDYVQIEKVDKILAPIYFLSFICLVFFVLINMFLAIINDTYADVKTEIAIAPDVIQMKDYVKRKFVKILIKWGFKISIKEKLQNEYINTVNHIRDSLRKCGFSDLEIEMFFARYNIDTFSKEEDKGYKYKTIFENTENLLSEKKKLQTNSSNVQLSDFIAQQERLEQIETFLEELHHKIDTLINKVENIEIG